MTTKQRLGAVVAIIYALFIGFVVTRGFRDSPSTYDSALMTLGMAINAAFLVWFVRTHVIGPR